MDGLAHKVLYFIATYGVGDLGTGAWGQRAATPDFQRALFIGARPSGRDQKEGRRGGRGRPPCRGGSEWHLDDHRGQRWTPALIQPGSDAWRSDQSPQSIHQLEGVGGRGRGGGAGGRGEGTGVCDSRLGSEGVGTGPCDSALGSKGVGTGAL